MSEQARRIKSACLALISLRRCWASHGPLHRREGTAMMEVAAWPEVGVVEPVEAGLSPFSTSILGKVR